MLLVIQASHNSARETSAISPVRGSFQVEMVQCRLLQFFTVLWNRALERHNKQAPFPELSRTQAHWFLLWKTLALTVMSPCSTFLLAAAHRLWDLSSQTRYWALQWKRGVLTIGSPGNSVCPLSLSFAQSLQTPPQYLTQVVFTALNVPGYFIYCDFINYHSLAWGGGPSYGWLRIEPAGFSLSWPFFMLSNLAVFRTCLTLWSQGN